MPGRHEAPGLGSYYRQLALFLVGLAAAGVVVIGGAAWLARGGGDASDGVGIGSATTVATSTTLTTVLSGTTATTQTNGASSTTSSSTTTTTLVPPGELTVVVLNATSRAGLAATVGERIRAAGYRTDEPGNHGERLDRSRVWYREGLTAEAMDLAARFVPDAVVEPYPFGEPPADIVVVLGASFEG